MTRPRRCLCAAVAVAFGARVAVLASPLANLNGDEGVTGLMASRIAHGHLFTFFAGQNYLGAIEAYLQAPFAALAPHNAFVLRLPIAALSAVTCVLVYLVGRVVLSSETRGLVAAWIYALGPLYALLYGERAMGAYAIAPVIGLGALYFAVRRPEPSRGDVLLLGGCAGLGAWATASTYYLVLPALVWALGSLHRSARRRLLLVVPGAVVGSAPLWIWMLRHHALAGLGSPPHLAGPLTRTGRLVVDALPQFLGVAWFGPTSVLPRALWWVAVGALLAAILVGLAGRLRRIRQRRPTDILLIGALTTAVLYVASPYTWYAAEPRYLYPALPLLAWALATIRPPAVPVIAVAALTVSAAVLHVGDYPAHWTPDLRAAARWLHTQGYPAAYADFRTAYPTDFVAGPDVAVVPYGANACRFPDLTRRVDGAPRFAYLASAAYVHEVDDALDRAGVPSTRHRFGSVDVVVPQPPVRPWQLGLTTRTGRC